VKCPARQHLAPRLAWLWFEVISDAANGEDEVARFLRDLRALRSPESGISDRLGANL